MTCAVPSCPRDAQFRGYCNAHYQRLQNYGDVLEHMPLRRTIRGTFEQRFWARVTKDGPIPANRPDLGPCWGWGGYIDIYGYGQFDRNKKAHRVAYELTVGPIQDGLVLDHLCRNRACVNPAHVEPVTAGENCLRGETFGAANLLITHCPEGHPYDLLNTYWTKAGTRKCRACNAERERRRRAVKAGAA